MARFLPLQRNYEVMVPNAIDDRLKNPLAAQLHPLAEMVLTSRSETWLTVGSFFLNYHCHLFS